MIGKVIVKRAGGYDPANNVECSVCYRIVGGRVPKGGDGSALIPYRHKHRLSGVGNCNGHLFHGKPTEAQ
jgi:hypothetical protein